MAAGVGFAIVDVAHRGSWDRERSTVFVLKVKMICSHFIKNTIERNFHKDEMKADVAFAVIDWCCVNGIKCKKVLMHAESS